jgi:alkylation response protein AidB-like acyl-CoA dehydrogenase
MRKAESELVGWARSLEGSTEGPIQDPSIRDRIARTTMRSVGFALTSERLSRGEPGHESSILKTLGTELKQRRAELAAEILGPRALGWEDDSYSDAELQVTQDWLRNRANTIEGGTTEIQLNIIARRVLGLK